MALLYTEGFDWLDSADVEADGYGLLTELIAGNGNDPTLTIESSSGRNGGGALKVNPATGGVSPQVGTNFQGVIIANPSPSAGETYIFGVAVKFDQLFNSTTVQNFAQVRSTGNNVELILARTADGVLTVGFGTAAYTAHAAGGSMSNGIWYYVECKFTLHATTGSVVVQLNGVEVINETNIDTLQTNNTPTSFCLGMNNWESGDRGDIMFDDFYLCDNNGSTNNDFLGDVQVQTLTPDGNGNSSDWTGSDADSTDNYLHVDESTPDDDTSYIEDNTSTNKDLFTYTATSNADTVYGVVVKSIAKKVDAGAANMYHVCRSNTTESDSSELGLSTSYLGVTSVYETDPDTTAAWISSGVDAAQFGVKVV